MFLLSFTLRRLKAGLCVALCLLLAVLGGVYLVRHEALPVSGKTGYDLRAGTEEERARFFLQFSVEIDPESKTVREVVIPQPLDDVYETYNELQLSQGFDLMPYGGKRVKCYSYDVLNAREKDGGDGPVHATILVYKGKVIGGDIAEASFKGSMEALIRE